MISARQRRELGLTVDVHAVVDFGLVSISQPHLLNSSPHEQRPETSHLVTDLKAESLSRTFIFFPAPPRLCVEKETAIRRLLLPRFRRWQPTDFPKRPGKKLILARGENEGR